MSCNGIIHLHLAHYIYHSSKFIWLLWQSCLNKILQISWTPAWVLIFSCFLFSRCTMLWLLEHLRCRQFLQKKGWSCKTFLWFFVPVLRRLVCIDNLQENKQNYFANIWCTFYSFVAICTLASVFLLDSPKAQLKPHASVVQILPVKISQICCIILQFEVEIFPDKLWIKLSSGIWSILISNESLNYWFLQT